METSNLATKGIYFHFKLSFNFKLGFTKPEIRQHCHKNVDIDNYFKKIKQQQLLFTEYVPLPSV